MLEAIVGSIDVDCSIVMDSVGAIVGSIDVDCSIVMDSVGAIVGSGIVIVVSIVGFSVMTVDRVPVSVEAYSVGGTVDAIGRN